MVGQISRTLAERIRAVAAADPGREVCGLLLGAGGIVGEARPCANVATDPATTFEIDPAALIAAHRASRAGGPAVLGCYHSHPNGVATPSPRDLAAAQPGQLWAIATLSEVRLFARETNGFVELPIGGGAAMPCHGGEASPLTADDPFTGTAPKARQGDAP